MSGTVRDRLRRETAEAHAALEAELDLAASLQSREDLARVLGRFLGFFAPLERALDTHLGAAVMAGRHRVPCLAHDLAGLGVDAAALPRSHEAGALAGADAAWGALYVTEGARLGGQLIARDLARRGLADDLRFWRASVAGGPSWPAFVAALDAHVTDTAAAAAGARDTFARLRVWMTGCTRPDASLENRHFRRPGA